MEYYWFSIKEMVGLIRVEERHDTYLQGDVVVTQPFHNIYYAGTIPYEVVEGEATQQEWDRESTLQ